METENSTHIDISASETPDKDNFNAQNKAEAEAAEAESGNKKIAALPAGKFKSVEALTEAYLNLEAEFTRRSQRLKELEENKAVGTPSPTPMTEEEFMARALSDERIKSAVVGEYLKSVTALKSVPLMAGGVACAAPVTSPKSVKEAGALAKQFLNN